MVMTAATPARNPTKATVSTATAPTVNRSEVDEKNIYELGVKAVAATWQSLIKGRDFKEFPLRTKL